MRRPEFLDMDPLFEEAAEFAVLNHHITAEDIQNHFGLGLPRAEKVLEQLEGCGFIGPQESDIPGETLLSGIEELRELLGTPIHDEIVEYEYDYEYGPDGEPVKELLSERGTVGNSKTNPEYSDSVNAMNGCLGYVGQVISYMCIILLFILLSPVIAVVLLVWWIVAWILGLIFPGKEFFPIKKIFNSISPWFERTFGISLQDVAIASILVVAIGALLNGVSNLFSKKD